MPFSIPLADLRPRADGHNLRHRRAARGRSQPTRVVGSPRTLPAARRAAGGAVGGACSSLARRCSGGAFSPVKRMRHRGARRVACAFGRSRLRAFRHARHRRRGRGRRSARSRGPRPLAASIGSATPRRGGRRPLPTRASKRLRPQLQRSRRQRPQTSTSRAPHVAQTLAAMRP